MSQGGEFGPADLRSPNNRRLRDVVLARSVRPTGPHTVDLVFGPRLFGFLKLGDKILLEPRSLGYWTRFEPGPLDLAAELGPAGADVVEATITVCRTHRDNILNAPHPFHQGLETIRAQHAIVLERFSDALHAPRRSPRLPPLRKGGKVGGVWSFFPPCEGGTQGGFFECLCVAPGSASRRLITALVNHSPASRPRGKQLN